MDSRQMLSRRIVGCGETEQTIDRRPSYVRTNGEYVMDGRLKLDFLTTKRKLFYIIL